ncbi:MAG TPA: hypothetical protein DCL42_10340 [Deltaproteobacteria bacterium]|nr:hypothetical protein [Deltaproteobacteria bacterium]
MGEELKYGHRHGGKVAVPVAMAASQVISAQSGKFVYMNAGAATLNVDGSTTIFGHLEAHAHTPATSAVLNCIVDLTAVFRIPVNSGTYVVGMQGDLCDISISSDIQGAQLDASVEDTLIVVGGSAAVYVDVMMNPSKWGTGLGVDA